MYTKKEKGQPSGIISVGLDRYELHSLSTNLCSVSHSQLIQYIERNASLKVLNVNDCPGIVRKILTWQTSLIQEMST